MRNTRTSKLLVCDAADDGVFRCGVYDDYAGHAKKLHLSFAALLKFVAWSGLQMLPADLLRTMLG